MKKLDKTVILDLLKKVFTDGANNLILAIGYGEYVTNSWEFFYFESPEDTDMSLFDSEHVTNKAEYSNTDDAEGVKFVTDYTNPDVLALGQLVGQLSCIDEDKLTLLCAREEIGNEFWDTVVCINDSGDIVIHEVRDDGMITKDRAVLKKLDAYAK